MRSGGEDLGLGFDGDGDRVAFVDHNGDVVSAKECAWVLLHSFGTDLDGGDDGLYTACRMVSHLGTRSARIAELCRECPDIFITPDLRLEVEAPRQEQILSRVRELYREYPQTTLDGVRVDFPEGWALVRRSVTEALS